ncbi:MAG: HD domain-containing protein [Nitrospira sp.]|nr:HD domain-containing protein [Nitrospira sp.]
MNWYREAEQELTETAAAIQSQRPFRIEQIEALGSHLISSLKQSDELVVHALSRPAGSPLITNLLNAAIFGSKVGIGLGYYGTELDRLAFFGLVHDIGLFAVPQSLVTKTGRLTQEERKLIEQHPELGYQLVHRMETAYQWLAQLIREAHERFNGQGYPYGLKGRQVSEMAQIIGLVDIFDALVSERPYRRRLLPHEAVKELLVTERTAFPRELLKALIEQLSVYPVGTCVRLSTGEIATVDRINSRYPLRPLVRIWQSDTSQHSDTCQLDLSMTPLVSISATVGVQNSGRVEFPNVPQQAEAVSGPGDASEQFTSLLESLDAIATAIQGVVEVRIAESRDTAPPRSDHQVYGQRRSMFQGRDDRTFQKEIVGLFALEAREWLAQIQAALEKLGAGADGAMRSKLYGLILNGITNLAGSAATVQLSDIEAMASNLLPILRDVAKPELPWTAATLRPLHAGLDRIAEAVYRLSGESADTGTPEGTANRAEPGRRESEPYSESAMHDPPAFLQRSDWAASARPLLHALQELQRARARSVQPARDVLETVISRAQQEVGERQDNITVEVIERILHDLDRLDEEFLRELHERVPAMTEHIIQLREHGNLDFVTVSQFDPILVHVDALHQSAKTVDAVTITMFLQGLRFFLASTAYRKVDALPQRLRAMEERVQTLIPMAEQWVALGRLERTSIEKILPL